VPISCNEIDIPSVLGDFQATLASLSCKYLGLPLSLGKLRREDEQKIIAKVATKLPRWKGRLLNKSGRLTLVNLVLSSVVMYHMTVFSLSKWYIKKIDHAEFSLEWIRGHSTGTLPHQLAKSAKATKIRGTGNAGPSALQLSSTAKMAVA
jgi:hypothetical protein